MRPTLGYQPALDGIRALSIALVLAFHLGFGWMEGGYLGVSVFFTLSGFLITSLLLAERTGTGRIDVRAFYVRRMRRLLPASLVCLAGVALLASTGTIAERADLRGGLLGALFQVANWEALLGERSYADLFLTPSPIDHFWSLAIEEQFYWLWPLAIAGLTAVASRARTVAVTLGATFVALAAGAVVTAQVLGGDAAYFASWARFAEILAGAALAAIVAVRPVPTRVRVLAGPCLLAIVGLSIVTPAGRGWAYGGGLPLFALLSVGLIAATQVDGRVTRLLAREPLPAIGRVSYGLYLFHWPVFTVMDGSSWLTKLAVTGALTVASYHVVERPIRLRRILAAPVSYVGAAATAVVVVAAGSTVLVPTVSPRSSAPVVISAVSRATTTAAPPATTAAAAPESVEPSTTAAQPSSTTGPPSSTTRPPAPTTTTAPPPAVVAVFGDSVADWLLRDAAPSFSRSDVTLIDAAIEGCDGAIDPPTARHRTGNVMPLPAGCHPWTESYPPVAESTDLPVDIALLVIGNRPIVDHDVNGAWISPCVDMDWYVADVEARVEYLRSRVDRVVLAMPAWGGKAASFLVTDDHLVRAGCIRDELGAMAARIGLPVVDLAEVLCPEGPAGACPDVRADGVHVDAEDAPGVLEWLLDRVLV